MPSDSMARSVGLCMLLAICVRSTSSAFAISVSVGGEFRVLAGANCPPSCSFEGENRFGNGSLTFTGTVRETIVPGTSAKLFLTDFTVAPIGPPTKGTVHFDGNYSNRSSGQVMDAHAGFNWFRQHDGNRIRRRFPHSEQPGSCLDPVQGSGNRQLSATRR